MMKNINIALSDEEYELLRRRKEKLGLTWKQLLFRILREEAWRIEELEYHLDRIVAIFPEAREVLEEARRKILELMRD